ncbi:MAG: translation initiation factor IF-2 [Phycisphaerales bacterium JB065]
MAKAKRVHEIAKDLGVKSKAIVDKCEAEGIPGITNHMSSVSAGLEATIREWFAGGEAQAEVGGTAVETAAKVDLTKARVKRKASAKKKATSSGGDSDTDTAVAVEEPPSATKAPAATKKVQPASPGDADKEPESSPEPVTKPVEAVEAPKPVPAKPDIEVQQTTASKTEPKAEKPAEKAASSPTEPVKAEQQPVASEPADAEQPTPPKAEAPAAEPVMNVPSRPKVITPAGPTIKDIEKNKPKLSGPKVIRVETPDVIEAPRQRRSHDGPSIPMSRGPRGGGGAGGPMLPPSDEAGARRNRRRGGGGVPETAAPGRKGKGPGTGGGGRNWRHQDLVEREERLSRADGFLRQRRRDQKARDGSGGTQKAQSAAETGGTVKIAAPFTIKDLSAATGVKGADIVKKLFMQGVMASINSAIDPEKAQELMIDWDIELEVTEQATGAAAVLEEFEQREMTDERPRFPVVTILGHVDHGKTSLLDYIRKANVAKGEAGGITQATSAFLVDVNAGQGAEKVCFLDTPGHEAFTEMRSRGASMTDIVVLVIAADDGVMPQTVESINHAKAAGVPLLVALNKIDLPGANNTENIQRIYGQLAEHGLNPTEWGGDTEVIKVSAHTGEGIDTLLETLALTAEIQEFKADFAGAATGSVIESKMEEGRGATANILVQQGELKVGDFIVAGRAFGRVRDITSDRGEKLKTAGPSTPVQISGIDELPDPGDKFYIVKTLKRAEQAAEQRREEDRQRQLAQPKLTLDSMFASMDEQATTKELLVVLKADVQGSIDAIKKSIEDVSTDEIKIRVLHAAVGGITESDVTLAAASGAIVFGFNVIPSAKARRQAEDKGVELRSYRVIYDIVDDVRKAASGLLSPEVREEILGHAEVRQVFRITKVGSIAGCYVTDGVIERNALIRVTRNDIVIEQDRVLEQLKRFKDDAKEVKSGQECGMKIVGYDDIKEGDILECFRKTEVARQL